MAEDDTAAHRLVIRTRRPTHFTAYSVKSASYFSQTNKKKYGKIPSFDQHCVRTHKKFIYRRNCTLTASIKQSCQIANAITLLRIQSAQVPTFALRLASVDNTIQDAFQGLFGYLTETTDNHFRVKPHIRQHRVQILHICKHTHMEKTKMATKKRKIELDEQQHVQFRSFFTHSSSTKESKYT